MTVNDKWKVNTFVEVRERATGKWFRTPLLVNGYDDISHFRTSVTFSPTDYINYILFIRDSGRHVKNVNHARIDNWRIKSTLVCQENYGKDEVKEEFEDSDSENSDHLVS
jgi:hypothetical protein